MKPDIDDGFRGIWYFNQPQADQFRYKYSGGFATYPQQIIPIAVYAPDAGKTFFCYGGRQRDGNAIANMVSAFDHTTGELEAPRIVLTRGTSDAHYNATLALDPAGHVLLFCNSHGQGYELDAHDPTFGKSYVYRGDEPGSLDSFTCTLTDNFSYSQVWPVEGQGLLWLHTRYDGGIRRLFWASSADGIAWSAPQLLTRMQRGNYQISWVWGERVATAFDVHPENDGLNARTNIYYLETFDCGRTWRTVDGRVVETPLEQFDNPALACDYRQSGQLVYLKDIQLDRNGRPVILYITSYGPWSGPGSAPRAWCLAHWNGANWTQRELFPADHNYDHGSLYIEPDNTWRLIAPTLPGPQPGGTGGTVTIHTSQDEGYTWQQQQRFEIASGRNQTYVRRPLGAQPDFYALWADGNPFEPSESYLYMATQAGRAFLLPPAFSGPYALPERLHT